MGEKNLKFSNRWMFNRVMCEENVRRRVIRAALGIEAGEITYLNYEQAYEPGYDSRSVRMDVVAKESGRIYDIEMQCDNEPALGRRMRYYQSVLDMEALERGEQFDRLPESFIVFVCCSDAFGLGLPAYTFERMCSEVPDISVGDGSHWVVLNARAWERARGTDMGDLLEYVQTGKATGELSHDIDALVRTFNEDRKWVGRVVTLEQDLAVRRRRNIEEGIKIGVEQGMEQGIEQGEERFGALATRLLEAGRADDLLRAAADPAFKDALYQELGL